MNAITRISVVVPMCDEAKSLSSLVDSLRGQTFVPAEIILVDGGSRDETIAVAKQLTKGDDRFLVVEAGNATPGRARNVGIAAARCDWVALTDAGIRLEPTWLEHLVEVVERDPGVSVVYGNYEPVTETFFERCAALSYPSPKERRPGGLMRGPSIASSLLLSDVWKRVGGFPDLRATEDLIFMERIQEHGFKLGWAPTATVWWNLEPTLVRTFRKFVVYSRNAVQSRRQRQWHYGVAKIYLLGLPFFVLAVAHSPWWLVFPLLGALARVAKSIWVRRESRGLVWLLQPSQFFAVGVILFTLDLATFVGWWQAAWSQERTTRDESRQLSVPHTDADGAILKEKGPHGQV